MATTPDFNQAALVWSLPWDSDWVTSVCFIGATRRLAAGNHLGQILMWELPSEPKTPAPLPVIRLDGHSNGITKLLSTGDGRSLISASLDHTIRYWDMHDSPQDKEALVLNTRALALERPQRSGTAVLVPAKAEVRVQKPVRVLESHKEWINALALSRDESWLVSGDDQGQVILWDRPASRELGRWQGKVKGWVHALALSPDKKQIALSERVPLYPDSHYGCKVCDSLTGTLQQDLARAFTGANPKLAFAAMAYSPDGKLLALGRGGASNASGGNIFLVDPQSGKTTRELLPPHQFGVTDLAFHPDGKHLLSSGRDTLVRVWSVADGKLVKELGKPRGTANGYDWIHAISISADGSWLAAADMAGQVQVWSLG